MAFAAAAFSVGLDKGVDMWTGVLKDAVGNIASTVSQIENKTRYLQIKLNNRTQFRLQREPEKYLGSGKIFNLTSVIKPLETGYLLVCNSDGSFMTGVSGAALYSVYDDSTNVQVAHLSLGFSNPFAGAAKLSAVFTSNPIDAYNSSTDDDSSAEMKFNQDKNRLVVDCFPGSPHAEFRFTMK